MLRHGVAQRPQPAGPQSGYGQVAADAVVLGVAEGRGSQVREDPGERGIAGLGAAPAAQADVLLDRAGVQEDAQRPDGPDVTEHLILAGQRAAGARIRVV